MLIEQCFDVLKARFPILNEMHSFSQSRQQLIVTACCELHNFIHMCNWADEMFHVWEGINVHSSDASIAEDARVGNRGNEKAFKPQPQ